MSKSFQMDLPDPLTGACVADRIPIYRVFNQRKDANHRYTTSTTIRDEMVGRVGLPKVTRLMQSPYAACRDVNDKSDRNHYPKHYSQTGCPLQAAGRYRMPKQRRIITRCVVLNRIEAKDRLLPNRFGCCWTSGTGGDAGIRTLDAVFDRMLP
jgi:hypothetical protein